MSIKRDHGRAELEAMEVGLLVACVNYNYGIPLHALENLTKAELVGSIIAEQDAIRRKMEEYTNHPAHRKRLAKKTAARALAFVRKQELESEEAGKLPNDIESVRARFSAGPSNPYAIEAERAKELSYERELAEELDEDDEERPELERIKAVNPPPLKLRGLKTSAIALDEMEEFKGAASDDLADAVVNTISTQCPNCNKPVAFREGSALTSTTPCPYCLETMVVPSAARAGSVEHLKRARFTKTKEEMLADRTRFAGASIKVHVDIGPEGEVKRFDHADALVAAMGAKK